MREHDVCSFDDRNKVLMICSSRRVIKHCLSSSKRGKMLGSRRTYKVILMIDIVKAWFTTCCRMCTLSADDMYNYERLRQRRKRIAAM